MKKSNLLSDLPPASLRETFEVLARGDGFRLERIVSSGQATPQGQWYDQDRDEWVMLAAGKAALLFEGESEPLVLEPGDHVLIPARSRHRVEWTAQGTETVWLALHFASLPRADQQTA